MHQFVVFNIHRLGAKHLFSRDGGFQRLVRTKRFWQPQRAFFMCISFVGFLIASSLAILLPEAPGDVVYENGGTIVDASHSDQGYIMIKRQSSKQLKMRLSLGKANLTYDLNNAGEYEAFTLSFGNGEYKVEVFEQTSKKKYSPASAITFSATVTDESLPFLYPNPYIWYNEKTQAVAKGSEVCVGAETDAQKAEAVYRYLLENMAYDYTFADEVAKGKNKGYIPNVDRTLNTQTGICLDFAAIMACMLRTQGVATKLVIGYADRMYHAWNLVLVDGTWYQYDVTMAICNGTVKKYTPERVY